MININSWLKDFSNALNQTFGDRAWFIGLQGSYSRNEAKEESDIDVVVILDEVNSEDIRTYCKTIDSLSHREKICGFLSGKSEIFNWEASDLFQFIHDTIPIKGSLNELLSKIDSEAVERAIKIGACNIYHGCVHNMIHEKSVDILKALYKSACFVIQAIYFKQSGEYVRSQKDLIAKAANNEKSILNNFSSLIKGAGIDFDYLSDALFDWSKNIVSNV